MGFRSLVVAAFALAAYGAVTEELAKQIGMYPVTHDSYPGTSLLDAVTPYLDVTDNDWALAFLHNVLDGNPYRPPTDISALYPILIAEAETQAERELLGSAITVIFRGLGNVADSVVTGPKMNSTSDAEDVWDNVAQQPKSLSESESDEAFARYRLAGLYPNAIRKANWTLLRDMKVLSEDCNCDDVGTAVEAAMNASRLYAVDYSAVSGLGLREGKHVGSPVALFEIPEDTATNEREGLKVLCIQVHKGVATSLVSPQSNKWAWQYAKLFFNHAEAQLLESTEHLGKAHLVSEAITLSLRRSLLLDHPISQLMAQHVYGTLQINYFADHYLTSEKGTVARLMSIDVDTFKELAAEGALEKMAGNFTFPALMEAAGLSESQFGTEYYPYREFGMKYWNVISRYVTKYVETVYASDEELNDDAGMERLRKELISNHVAWVADEWAEGQGTRAFVSDLLAAFVFTESVQHAAVGYTQFAVGSVADIFPLSWNTQPPTDMSLITTDKQIASAMPNMAEAYYQRDALTLLSLVHRSFASFDPLSFEGDAQEVAYDFQADLSTIEAEMNARNTHWVSLWEDVASVPSDLHDNWSYTALLNSYISMSTNI